MFHRCLKSETVNSGGVNPSGVRGQLRSNRGRELVCGSEVVGLKGTKFVQDTKGRKETSTTRKEDLHYEGGGVGRKEG